MAQVSTATGTLGSILGTVTTAATTVTRTLDAASNSVGMLNAFVSKAAREQSIAYAAETHNFKRKLSDRLSAEEATRRKGINELCSDPIFKDLFLEAQKEIDEVLKGL